MTYECPDGRQYVTVIAVEISSTPCRNLWKDNSDIHSTAMQKELAIECLSVALDVSHKILSCEMTVV